MAVISAWTLPPTKFADLTDNEFEKVMRGAAIEVGTRLINKTPVDTGRARGGWLPSVDSPAKGEGVLDPTGAYALRRLQSAFKPTGYNAYSTLYITNNVPYIGRLNEGSSRQAPANFVEQTVAEVFGVL